MSHERQPSTPELLCQQCPNRNRLSKLLARVANLPVSIEGCDGPVDIYHRNVSHTEWQSDSGEPQSRQPKGRDVSMIVTSSREAYPAENFPLYGTDEEKAVWYARASTRIEATTVVRTERETVCGRESIEPADYEKAIFSDESAPVLLPNGRRAVAFISGDERGFESVRFGIAISRSK